jgi:two-component sensor histidine kinase
VFLTATAQTNKNTPMNILALIQPIQNRVPQTTSMHSEDGYCILFVGDNGSGVPDGFDWQNTRSLGLKLVNRLVDQLKGDLKVNSTSFGAAFKITFPI